MKFRPFIRYNKSHADSGILLYFQENIYTFNLFIFI